MFVIATFCPIRIEAEQHMKNLIPSLTYDNFKQQELVIEAVFEDIKIKHRVVEEVEKVRDVI